MARLTEALLEVLRCEPAEAQLFRDRLAELLPAAVAGSRLTPEARVLFDLQAIHAEEIRDDPIDLVEWARTLGARPMQRPMRTQRRLVALRRLTRAHHRLDAIEGSQAARSLADAILPILRRMRRALRENLHPRLVAVFDQVGMHAESPAEITARDKLANELLDKMLRRGYLDFGDLRDGIARSPVKLADVRSLSVLWAGDALLAANARLAEELDGIYFRGELYLRLLHQAQSIAFGTRVGRFLSRFVALPFGGALVVLEFAGWLSTFLVPELHLVSLPWILGLGCFLLAVLEIGVIRGAFGRAVVALWEAIAVPSHPSEKLRGTVLARTGRTLGSSSSSVATAWKDWMNRIETASYHVDEWLRYHSGNRWVLAIMSLVWFALSYGFRFVIRLILEPTVNPVKHFPVVTVAGKISIASGIPYFLTQSLWFLGPAWAVSLGSFIGVLLIPGFCGFLAWELRWNWRLFEANRTPHLASVSIGPHGESMLRLMRPGFYSGVIPKTFARLERAERERGTQSAHAVRHRHHLEELEEALHVFIEREFLALPRQCSATRSLDLHVHQVRLAPDVVRWSFTGAGRDSHPVEIALRVEHRRLVATVEKPGFLADCTAEQRTTIEAALVGGFALLGVHFFGEAPAPRVCWTDWVRFWGEPHGARIMPWPMPRGLLHAPNEAQPKS